MSIKLEAPPRIEKSVTITFTGKDFDILQDIAVFDASIPELVEPDDSESQQAVQDFLGRLQIILQTPEEQ